MIPSARRPLRLGETIGCLFVQPGRSGGLIWRVPHGLQASDASLAATGGVAIIRGANRSSLNGSFA